MRRSRPASRNPERVHFLIGCQHRESVVCRDALASRVRRFDTAIRPVDKDVPAHRKHHDLGRLETYLQFRPAANFGDQ